MRYLEIASFNPINSVLSRMQCADGSLVTGRIEAYSCTKLNFRLKNNRYFLLGKAAGNDKKLLRKFILKSQLSKAYQDEGLSGTESDSAASAPPLLEPKLLLHLVSLMNLVFPDYDFRYVY